MRFDPKTYLSDVVRHRTAIRLALDQSLRAHIKEEQMMHPYDLVTGCKVCTSM